MQITIETRKTLSGDADFLMIGVDGIGAVGYITKKGGEIIAMGHKKPASDIKAAVRQLIISKIKQHENEVNICKKAVINIDADDVEFSIE